MAAVRTRAGRVVRVRTTFTNTKLVDTFIKSEQREKQNKRLWTVEAVREKKDGQVLVKWLNYGEQHNSWVSLADNPELASYLNVNAGNPNSSVLAKQDLPALSEEERELWLVKHAVFDELKFRRTPETDAGLSRRVQVKVPFSKKAFSTLFEKGTFPLSEVRQLDFSGTRNVRFSCTTVEIASVFGSETFTRQFPDSSTVCEADPCSKVFVSWGYELRVNYDHSSCPRCTYALGNRNEDTRPNSCQPKELKLPPISYLEISFKRRRRNMVHNLGKVWINLIIHLFHPYKYILIRFKRLMCFT